MQRGPRRARAQVVAPRQYTPEEMAALGARLREVAPKLAAATAEMDAALRRAEAALASGLGDATACVLMRRERGRAEHLMLLKGRLVVRTTEPGRGPSFALLLHAERDVRILAAGLVRKLFLDGLGAP